MSKWIGVTETNKSWLLVFFLALVGGCLGYIVYKALKLLRRKTNG